MRRSRDEVDARRQRLAELIRAEQFLSVGEVCEQLGISEATARRDLRHLHEQEKIRRTPGGALSGYDQGFRSFQQRLNREPGAKQQLAARAVRYLAEGMTIFVDGGTTMHFLARAIAERDWEQLQVCTNNLPVAEVLSGSGLRTILTGGEYLSRQSVLFGATAERTVREMRFDLAFLGAEGMNAEGLWNSHEDITRFQRAVTSRAHRSCFLLDGSKLGRSTDAFLCEWSAVDHLLTDAAADQLATHHIPLPAVSAAS